MAACAARFGNRLVTSQAVREQHGRDESSFQVPPPDAVVFAETQDECVAIVKLCAEHRWNLIPYGVGTSLEGHVLAIHGGISVDMSRMNKVLAVNEADLDVVVQPGVTRKQLNEYIRATGLFFPIDPGADASIGGMCSTRASGTNAVRYGTMKDNVLALEVVTASGANAAAAFASMMQVSGSHSSYSSFALAFRSGNSTFPFYASSKMMLTSFSSSSLWKTPHVVHAE